MKLFAILLHPTSASKHLLISPYSLRLLYFALHFLYADDFFFCFPYLLSSSSETAVDLGGVHCTFWSLGQSLGPQGFVNNFVLATFCRHLFLGPGGHPSASKKHYFFPSVSV